MKRVKLHQQRILAKRLRAKGCTYKHIAHVLNVSIPTVGNYLRAIEGNAPSSVTSTNVPRDSLQWFGIPSLDWQDVEEVWVNKYDLPEIVIKASGSYHDWYGQHSSLMRCYEADGLDYGDPNPFVALPIESLPGIARAYISLADRFEWLFAFCNDAYKLKLSNEDRETLLSTKTHPCDTDLMFSLIWALRTGQLLRELLPDLPINTQPGPCWQSVDNPLLTTVRADDNAEHVPITHCSMAHLTALATRLQLDYFYEFRTILHKFQELSLLKKDNADPSSEQSLAAYAARYFDKLTSLHLYFVNAEHHWGEPATWLISKPSGQSLRYSVQLNGLAIGTLSWNGCSDAVDAEENSWSIEPCDGAISQNMPRTFALTQIDAIDRLHAVWSKSVSKTHMLADDQPASATVVP